MIKNPRRKVVRFIERLNDGSEASRNLWMTCSSAALECGHIINLGVGTSYRPEHMGCRECAARMECERCAKIAEEWRSPYGSPRDLEVAQAIAEAIRKSW